MSSCNIYPHVGSVYLTRINDGWHAFVSGNVQPFCVSGSLDSVARAALESFPNIRGFTKSSIYDNYYIAEVNPPLP